MCGKIEIEINDNCPLLRTRFGVGTTAPVVPTILPFDFRNRLQIIFGRKNTADKQPRLKLLFRGICILNQKGIRPTSHPANSSIHERLLLTAQQKIRAIFPFSQRMPIFGFK